MSRYITEPITYEKSDDWKEEWKEMPEFVQLKQKPYAQIIVRFSNAEDYEDFQRRIDQKLTPKTKSIWHPRLEKTGIKQCYDNES